MESEGTYQHKNLIKNRGWGRCLMALLLDKELQQLTTAEKGGISLP